MGQRDVGPNSHGEEQEGISMKKKDKEGPKGSNAPRRLVQQDTSRPSVTDTASPHMVMEM